MYITYDYLECCLIEGEKKSPVYETIVVIHGTLFSRRAVLSVIFSY